MNSPKRTPKKTAPAKWFAVAVADLDKISNNRTGGNKSVMLSIWLVLLREAHFKRSLTVTMTDAMLADRTGLSSKTVSRYKSDLEAAKLASAGRKVMDKATRRYLPTKWTLTPSVKPFMERKPSDSVSHGPSDSESHGPWDTGSGSQCPELLQSSPGGCQSPAPRGEETVSTEPGRRLPSHRGGRSKAASPSEATPPVRKEETELEAVRRIAREAYR